jgi:hypothetical protein
VALPTLKTTGGTLTTSSQATIVGTVTTGRALVISKLCVSTINAVTLTIVANGWIIANAYPLPANSIYTETGIVVVGGGTLTVQAVGATSTNTATVAIFGEEVDN